MQSEIAISTCIYCENGNVKIFGLSLYPNISTFPGMALQFDNDPKYVIDHKTTIYLFLCQVVRRRNGLP